MPRLPKKLVGTSLASTALIIAGCAALTPSWEYFIDEPNPSSASLYMHTDGNSFYRYSHEDSSDQATLQLINMNGSVVKESTIPLDNIHAYYVSAISPNDSNEVILLNKDLEDTFVFDPESDSVISQINLDFLEDNQHIKVSSSHVLPGSRFLFSGKLVTELDDGDTKVTIMGLMERDGEISHFSVLPNIHSLSIYKLPTDPNFLLLGRYTKEHTDNTGLENFLKTITPTMEELTSVELEETIIIRQLLNDRFLGSSLLSPNPITKGVFNFQGELIGEEPANNTQKSILQTTLVGKNYYYTVGTSYKELFSYGDGVLTIHQTRLEVCQYDFDFEQTWCKTSNPARSFAGIQAQIVNDDEIGVSFRTFSKDVTNVDFSLIGDDLTFLADADLMGRVDYQVNHWLLTTDGKRRLDISESPYSYTGSAKFDYFWDIDVEAEETHPGVIHPIKSLFLPGEKVITYSRFNGDQNSATGSKLSMWEK